VNNFSNKGRSALQSKGGPEGNGSNGVGAAADKEEIMNDYRKI
jgi:hypothetical protein